jgi:hypothetical protein
MLLIRFGKELFYCYSGCFVYLSGVNQVYFSNNFQLSQVELLIITSFCIFACLLRYTPFRFAAALIAKLIPYFFLFLLTTKKTKPKEQTTGTNTSENLHGRCDSRAS